jgi:hypothetical protein
LFIEGVEQRNNFYLSDPVILYKDILRSFGSEKLLSISEKMDGINMKPSIINIENAIVV